MSSVVRAFEYFIAILFASLVATILAQIVFRYFLGTSLSWAEEIARYTFVWLVYLAGILAVREGLNITFDILLNALPDKLWAVLFLATNIVVCGFLALVAYLGVDATADMRQVSSILRIPMRYVYLAIPVGALGMLIAQINYCIRCLRRGKQSHLEVV